MTGQNTAIQSCSTSRSGTRVDSFDQNDEPDWLVLQTKTHQEQKVVEILRIKNQEAYLPLIQSRLLTFGKPVNRVHPLFPQYVFLRLKSQKDLFEIRWMSGVKQLVCYNGTPAAISNSYINCLKKQQNSEGFITIKKNFKSKQKVIVKSGIMKDFEGLFVKHLSGQDRVLVLMKIMGCYTQVEMSPFMLSAI